MAQPRHLLRMPDEVLVRAVNNTRESGESPSRFHRRMVRTAGACKKLANLLRPTIYKVVEISLGDNINPERNPVDESIRHARRCRRALTETHTYHFSGMIEWSSNPEEDNVAQTISARQIARLFRYTPSCRNLELQFLEILDPDGEHASHRREERARDYPELLCSTDDEDEELGEWRGMGEKAKAERKARRKERRDREDEEDGPEPPTPRAITSMKSLTIERTYHTTPNALIEILALCPNLTQVSLDNVEWMSNYAPVLPDPAQHRIEQIFCSDVTFTPTTAHAYDPGEPAPTLPILTFPGITRSVRTLYLGHGNCDRDNAPDTLSWENIPLQHYACLEELTLATVVARNETGQNTTSFFQAATSMIRNAPPTLTKLTLAIFLEGSTGEYGTHHIRPEYWNRMCEGNLARWFELSLVLITEPAVAVNDVINLSQAVRTLFASYNQEVEIRYTTRQESYEGMRNEMYRRG